MQRRRPGTATRQALMQQATMQLAGVRWLRSHNRRFGLHAFLDWLVQRRGGSSC